MDILKIKNEILMQKSQNLKETYIIIQKLTLLIILIKLREVKEELFETNSFISKNDDIIKLDDL